MIHPYPTDDVLITSEFMFFSTLLNGKRVFMFPMLMITSIYVSHVDDNEYLCIPC